MEQVNILLMLMSQVLQELGHLACGFMCTCTRGPDGEPLCGEFLESANPLYLMSFFNFRFCWVIYSALCLSTLFAFVHNDCAKYHVMRAKDAIEI